MKRSTKVWIAVVVIGMVFLGFLWVAKLPAPPAEPVAPALAGQTVPTKLYSIDFTKRYDFICTSSGTSPLIYHNCRILGFTGDGGKDAESQSSGSLGSQPRSYSGDTFDQWVVLELPDKRRAFIPPTQIEAFEEAKVSPKGASK